MRLTRRSVVSLTPADPGWDVEVTKAGEEAVLCPVIGWAVVVLDTSAEGVTETAIEPAFVYDGAVYTPAELAHSIGELDYQLIEPEE
ncbi:hypothetical protein [Streptomyces sp. SID3343]|uniref:hypothetical protein n=1 Tax=Streptomyces sp. SID3343 TaxID=2690260 RepID=UPI001369033F|nr:hypothetical protein [Streptomyces sp. SID3343]MYV97334.1 hypothetical protein [Streptomyces sp. SID3343]